MHLRLTNEKVSFMNVRFTQAGDFLFFFSNFCFRYLSNTLTFAMYKNINNERKTRRRKRRRMTLQKLSTLKSQKIMKIILILVDLTTM